MVARTILVVAAVGALGLLLASQRSSPMASERTSACGTVGLMARDLGLARTRELTLCLLNEERAKRGLTGLVREPRLELASQRHSEDMVKRRFFEHDAPGGVDPYERMAATGYPVDNATTGENIAWGTGPESSPVEIVDSWMRSPGHRDNILRAQFNVVGVGVAEGAPAKPRSEDPPATYTTDFGGPPLR